MARSVLRNSFVGLTALHFIIAFLSCSVLWSQVPKTHCEMPNGGMLSPTNKQLLQDLRESTETGTLFETIQRRSGRPKNCKIKVDGDNIVLSYAFSDSSQLEALINPVIEYSEQRAQLPGQTTASAMKLLRRSAVEYLGGQNCGIRWSKSEEETNADGQGTHSTVFRGDSCNCQARIVFRGSAVETLILKTSC